MTTVGQAVETLEQSLLIARENELSLFRAWLRRNGSPELLNVSGPPGVGKTTLLQAFMQEAVAQGRNVASVDGQSFGATPQGLLAALSETRSTDIDEVIAELNENETLIFFDAFEQLEHLAGFLQSQLLPRLDTRVKIVIAGRHPLVLAWRRSDGWPKIVRLLPLDAFSPRDSRYYLAIRGLGEPRIVESVIRATGGNPLALSLAADIALQFGARHFDANSQWRLAARQLVRRLVSEAADDRTLVGALEACSVVRVFDEPTLAAIMDSDDAGMAFDRLCSLSIVKPAAHGLALHDYVRTIIAGDHAWRQPVRHRELRRRALNHYRTRLREGSPEERDWLLAECFFLWGNSLVQEFLGGDELTEGITVADPVAADLGRLPEIHAAACDGLATMADAELLVAAVDFPGTRLRVARDRRGETAGFSAVVPVCEESVAFLLRHPLHRTLVEGVYGRGRREALPRSAETATAYYLLHVLASGEESGAVRSALLHDLAPIFSLGGSYLCTIREAGYDELMETCGFELLTDSAGDGDVAPAKGWILDLSRIGFEGWIETIIEGKRSHCRPNRVKLESELLGALAHWNDPEWLAANCTILGGETPVPERPAAVKRAIEDALHVANEECHGAMKPALRVIEVGYMQKRASHKAAMCELAVSRATFYRLCRRGVHALADQFLASHRIPSAAS